MNKDQPLVTVGIPTFNRCKMLKKALESIINQTYKNLEIIISDNHSQDDTQKMCEEYAAKDSRIKYLRQKENLGAHINGAKTVEAASGKYFCSLCDDDWISENFIEEAIKVLEQKPDYYTVGASVCLYDEEYNLLEKVYSPSFDSDNYIKRAQELFENFMKLRICLLFTRIELFKNIAAHIKNRFCEDQIFALKACMLGKIAILPQITYHKLDNGCTKNLETLVKTFNLEGFSDENFAEKLAQCHVDAILNDEFYDDKFSKEEREKLAKAVKKTIIKTSKRKNSFKEITNYMWHHPLFIFKKRFYSMLKSRL